MARGWPTLNMSLLSLSWPKKHIDVILGERYRVDLLPSIEAA
jgi:hypothetical protein